MNARTVIVTGAGSGMGRAEAERFATAGDRVAVLDLAGQAAQEAVDAIVAAGGVAQAWTVNVTDAAAIAGAVVEIVEQWGPIDVLVNNAGIFDRYATSLETSREQWDRVFAVNATSVFEVSNAVLPSMLEAGRGSIVNIASVAGLVAGKGGAAYTASKHAVIGYTKHLAAEYGPQGVRTNAVLPGTIETPLTKDILAGIPTDAIPLRRFGGADDVASVVQFLASDAAGFVNGACFTVDGGFTAL